MTSVPEPSLSSDTRLPLMSVTKRMPLAAETTR